MKTDLIKKIITAMCVAVIVATFGAVLAGCGDPYDVNIFDGIPNQLKDSDVAPDDVVVSTVKVGIADVLNDASLSNAQKIQKIMSATEQNEIKVERFAYFQYKVGSTDLGSNHGTLIYQRHRMQDQEVKDDTTLKRAVNHNFDQIALFTVQSAIDRFVYDGAYYRMETDADNIIYNEATGLLTIDPNAKWKRGDRFGSSETVASSQNLDETKKTCINWDCENIVLEESAKITQKSNPDGATYYELSFTINLNVANTDSKTIERLEQDNGGSGMALEKMEIRAEVWECGLMKFYETEETWSGTMVIYSGAADTHTYTWYSYSEREHDHTNSLAIRETLL